MYTRAMPTDGTKKHGQFVKMTFAVLILLMIFTLMLVYVKLKVKIEYGKIGKTLAIPIAIQGTTVLRDIYYKKRVCSLSISVYHAYFQITNYTTELIDIRAAQSNLPSTMQEYLTC